MSADQAVFREIPHKFEAGTPPNAQVIGLGAALDYIQDCGRAAIAAHEAYLHEHAVRVLSALTKECGLRLLGQDGLLDVAHPEAPPLRRVVPVLSFTVEGIPADDLASALDLEGIAVRAGHHCAQPLLQHLGVSSTLRASLAFYNTVAELDALAAGVAQATWMFRRR